MTISQLYAVYRAAHAEARRICDGGVLRPFEVSVNGAGLTALERLILDFALHDATNGTPVRSRQGFDHALEPAMPLLASLGLRGESDEGRSARVTGASALCDAA